MTLRDKIEAEIAASGHCIIYTETEEPAGIVPMAYTIGLSDVGQPEILVFGLPYQTSLFILNLAAERLRAGQLPLDTPIIKMMNLPVVFKAVQPDVASRYVIQANARARLDLDVIQMVWPDKAGKFPWQDGFDKQFSAMQPSPYLSE